MNNDNPKHEDKKYPIRLTLFFMTLTVLIMTSGLIVQQAVYAQVELNLGSGQSQSQGSTTGTNSTGVNSTQSTFAIPSSAVSTYKDSIGALHIVGQVQNNFTFPINYVQVIATVYDSSHQVVSTGNTYTDVDVLKPGEKSGFSILPTNLPSGASSYSLLASYQQASSPKPPALSLNVGSHNVDSINFYHLLGEVTNLGNSTASFVKISAVFFDANHKVVDAAYTYTTPTDLQPGQKAPFDLQSLAPNARDIKSASLNVESNEYSLTNSQPASSSTPAPTTPLTSNNNSNVIPLGGTSGSSHSGSSHSGSSHHSSHHGHKTTSSTTTQSPGVLQPVP